MLCQATLAEYSSDTLHLPTTTIMNRDNAFGHDGDADDADDDTYAEDADVDTHADDADSDWLSTTTIMNRDNVLRDDGDGDDADLSYIGNLD